MSNLKGSFIPTQAIRQLVVPEGEELNLLAYFQGRDVTSVSLALGESQMPTNAMGTAQRFHHLQKDQLEKLWPEIKRLEFLGDLTKRRIVISDVAGVGKTTLLQQMDYVLRKIFPRHLVMNFDLRDVPDSPLQFLSQDRNHLKPLLIQHMLEVFAQIERDLTEIGSRPFQCPSEAQVHSLIEPSLRIGDLTLIIDGIDQINLDLVESKAGVLRQFLKLYPKTRCVVAGRPYAITEIWGQSGLDLGRLDPETNIPVWDFISIDRYSKEETKVYLSSKVVDVVAKLDSDEVRLPRTANVIRMIPLAELDKMRTSSELYWYSQCESILESLEQKKSQQFDLTLGEMVAVSAAVAFGLWTWKKTPVMYAPLSQNTNEAYVDFRNHMKTIGLDERLRLEGFEAEASLKRLAQINTDPVRAGFYNRTTGMKGIEFSDATIRDFYAAHWAAKYLDLDRHQSANSNLELQKKCLSERKSRVVSPRERGFNEAHDKMWRLLIEMPHSSLREKHPSPSSPASFVQSVSTLFETGEDVNQHRPTELMWLAWPRLLDRAGILKIGTEADFLNNRSYRKDEIEDHDLSVEALAVQVATSELQIKVRHAVLSGNRLRSNNSAANLLIGFLSTYPELVYQGNKVARWFDSGFSDIPAGLFLYGDKLKQRQIHRPFQLSRYQTSNCVYHLFDPGRPVYENEFSPKPKCATNFLTWFDSYMFAVWVGGYLPTDLQWEAACRGKIGKLNTFHTKFSFGSSEDKLRLYGWYGANSGHLIHPVGGFRRARWVFWRRPLAAHPYNLFDVHGNVSEWTASRSVRGGAFDSSAHRSRCSSRDRNDGADSLYFVGCRVAKPARR